jgi:1,4-alpha-glucan branching enzyme
MRQSCSPIATNSSAIDYDGEYSEPVREFVIQNARYWIGESHLDGV